MVRAGKPEAFRKSGGRAAAPEDVFGETQELQGHPRGVPLLRIRIRPYLGGLCLACTARMAWARASNSLAAATVHLCAGRPLSLWTKQRHKSSERKSGARR
jgi:hypothetical protein